MTTTPNKTTTAQRPNTSSCAPPGAGLQGMPSYLDAAGAAGAQQPAPPEQ